MDGLYFCTGPPPSFTGYEISLFAGALFADFAMMYTTGISLYYETASSVAFYIILVMLFHVILHK